MNEFAGETTREFKRYYKLEIVRIRLENFGSIYEHYVEDIILYEYYAEMELSPFVGDDECIHISEFANNLFKELLRAEEKEKSLAN